MGAQSKMRMSNTAFPHSTGTDTPEGFVRTQMKMPLALGSSVPMGAPKSWRHKATQDTELCLLLCPHCPWSLCFQELLLPTLPFTTTSIFWNSSGKQQHEDAAPTNPSKFHQHQLNSCSEFPFCKGQLHLYQHSLHWKQLFCWYPAPTYSSIGKYIS